MKKVAIVGFGFMGKTHYGAWRKCPGAKVVAICDANLSQLTAKVEGNIKGVADNTAIPKSIGVYDNYERLLAAGGFDIVDITLPTVFHPQATVAALQAGYHVLCEKPMALNVRDCDRMIAAAKKAKRELLVAQCLRFFPEYAYVRELVRSARYGKVVAADFSRYIAAPKWSPKGEDWFLDDTKSGGVLFDVHIHDVDYILSLFGKPKKVTAVAHRNARGFVDHTSTVYGYGNMLVTSDSSFAAARALLLDAPVRVFFEHATVYAGGYFKQPVTVYPETGKPFSPKLPKTTGYDGEVRYFLSLVNGTAKDRTVLTAKDSRDAVAMLETERRALNRA